MIRRISAQAYAKKHESEGSILSLRVLAQLLVANSVSKD